MSEAPSLGCKLHKQSRQNHLANCTLQRNTKQPSKRPKTRGSLRQMDTWPWETGESGPNGAAKAKPKASSGDIFTLLPHFDGSKRAAWPGFRDLVRGTVTEFIAMTLFVYFGCGAASSNAVKVSGEWDPASVTIIALQFGLAITVLAFATAHTSAGTSTARSPSRSWSLARATRSAPAGTLSPKSLDPSPVPASSR